MANSIVPGWNVPDHVQAFFTTRAGGESLPPYASFNLGDHVGDEPGCVRRNRSLLQVPAEPVWLEQVHSTRCIDAGCDGDRQADAAYTRSPGVVLAVMVADCLPILITSRAEKLVGVVHAGWRGLADGIIESAVREMAATDLVAWIGPAIGACHYEVGDDVRQRFNEAGSTGFQRQGDRWMMNLGEIASAQLHEAGVTDISGGKWCTSCDEERFFSYRRDGVTGRMAGLIWMS